MTVGFIGLGDQGAPMARAIADKGFDLYVWARRPDSYRGGVRTTTGGVAVSFGYDTGTPRPVGGYF
ncbi:NAD(P)-binding domain-containing protein [Micromonospora sp. DT231]|uniref:NAD(P)-binding domain-containing protein n=1 Tax=Micromonospora sp. DT231 TaxID=3416526 RepID=UPI003CF49A60